MLNSPEDPNFFRPFKKKKLKKISQWLMAWREQEHDIKMREIYLWGGDSGKDDPRQDGDSV